MAVSVTGTSVTSTNSAQLPCISSVIDLADSQDKKAFSIAINIKEEPMDVQVDMESHKDEVRVCCQ